MLCPCHSQKPYQECCEPFHKGIFPRTALELMRSRYCAFSLGLIEYIQETAEKKVQKESLEEFSRETDFRGLDILEFEDREDQATVTFRAILFQGDKDTSFTEKSAFKKIESRWIYL